MNSLDEVVRYYILHEHGARSGQVYMTGYLRSLGLRGQRRKVNNNNMLFKIRNITVTNYFTFPLQIAYQLIEAGRSEDTLQVQSLSI